MHRLCKFLDNKEIASALLADGHETTLICCHALYSVPYEVSWTEKTSCSSCYFVEIGRTLWGQKHGDFITKVFRVDGKKGEKRLYCFWERRY
ncbi:hypothetical protein LAU_0059 [Lausannevirus]|uniref:Uncharacterized protein n=1 Tax=Lausannevirus TaxID=999883 RepID=F2WKZ2_9VIRU|nr:hypothetical protein LAU_0059 [Lausannevirus]AEA06915.1 hypothetical protein LAU_0059 [Lausannevirus]